MEPRIGGSFAPPLSDENLSSYQSLADAMPASPTKDAMQACLGCCTGWWHLPESTGDGKPHPSGRGAIVRLDDEIAKALDDHIPWDEELKMYAELFEKIDPSANKELRDAAFHCLWHAVELARGREPITADKL